MAEAWGPPPDCAAIEAIARTTLDALPLAFRRHLDGLLLVVEELPDEALLEAVGLDDPFDLTAVYEGRPVGEKSVTDVATLPDRVRLFRRPILDEWADGGETLEALIAQVVIHEIGHHFGLSDAQMLALEAAAG